MSDIPEVLALEPDDLDGHSIEELSDYLDRDRQPPDPGIDNSPACQMALTALQHLQSLASTYLDDDQAEAGDEDWIGGVLAALPLELRRGRPFPITVEDHAVEAHITEGALRGFIRATGDTVPGVLVGAVRLGPSAPDDSVFDLAIDIALVHGTRLPTIVRPLREGLHRALTAQAPFEISRIDIHVVDLIIPRPPRPGRAAA